jgi:hypothetical protein
VAEQGSSEWAVAAGAVERHLAGLGGVNVTRARPRPKRAACLREIGGKRIITAGMRKTMLVAALRTILLQREAELDGFKIEIDSDLSCASMGATKFFWSTCNPCPA